VLELVTPSTLIHGHYHSAYDESREEGWGTLNAFGIDGNGSKRWGVAVRDFEGEFTSECVVDD